MSQQQSVKNNEEKKSFPYLKVVKSIITSPRLTASDIRTYLVIASHYNSVTGLTFPALPTIAKEAGLHIQTILKSRKKLKELGLIQWRVKKTEKKSCQYELPLITGTSEQQQEVVGGLRYSEKITLPDTMKKSPEDTTKNSVVGRVKNSTTNKKKEQEENNNKADPVDSFIFSNQIQKQTQQQRYYFQKIWREWKISPESLKKYNFLQVLLWTLELQGKVEEESLDKRMAAGCLINSLKDNKREVSDEEGLTERLIEEWIPEETDTVYIDEGFFPRWVYLQQLSQEYQKPVKDLLLEGILDDKTIRDEDRDEPLLEEFTSEQLKIIREGKFEAQVKDYEDRVEKRRKDREKLEELRMEIEEGFFQKIEKYFWEVK